VVTIDGPAGVGKSTAAKLLARRLRLAYLDTGATYRALAYAALRAGVHPIEEASTLARMARRLPLEFSATPAGTVRVALDGADITKSIRTEEVSEAAAQVSQHARVRAAMVARQRELARLHAQRAAAGIRARPDVVRRSAGGIVVEGRDAGSVIFPQAPYKFFLDASPAVRARRRQRELAQLYGASPPLVQVREQMHFRDGLDRTRRVGALVRPRGAIGLDTSHLSASDVVRIMLRHIRAGAAGPGGSAPA
jgi:cytidylate kinase